MEQESPSKHDVIVAGIGGRGALITGQLLVEAAASQYNHVLWCPNMTTARRGAPADCTVVISDQEIGSPLVAQAETLILVDPSRLKAFEHRVQPAGRIFLETSGLKDNVDRTDVEVIKVPGLDTAARLGDTQAGNMVLLGAYVAKTKVISPDLVEAKLRQKFEGREKILSLNLDAFHEGIKLMRG